MSEICVAHLVREQNGLAPFERFIESYRAYPAGIAHTLLLIFKGFDERLGPGSPQRRSADGVAGGQPAWGGWLRQYEDLLGGIQYQTLFVEDEGFDIRAYLSAAKNFDQRYFCFLNSFSVILDDRWLLKMYKYIVREGVGVVAATGSHESLYNHFMQSWPRKRSLVFWLNVMLRHHDDFRRAVRYKLHYPAFPNYHVRTNAFMLPRETMLRLKVGALKSKEDAHRFESGRDGMTRQIQAMNLKPLVVGRDGCAYEVENWRESFTFRSGNQENLLVADNQTRYYESADAAIKRALTESTW